MPAKVLYRIVKLLKVIIVIILSLITLYLFFGLILSLLPLNPEKLDCLPEKEIYITSNGIHLDIDNTK